MESRFSIHRDFPVSQPGFDYSTITWMWRRTSSSMISLLECARKTASGTRPTAANRSQSACRKRITEVTPTPNLAGRMLCADAGPSLAPTGWRRRIEAPAPPVDQASAVAGLVHGPGTQSCARVMGDSRRRVEGKLDLNSACRCSNPATGWISTASHPQGDPRIRSLPGTPGWWPDSATRLHGALWIVAQRASTSGRARRQPEDRRHCPKIVPVASHIRRSPHRCIGLRQALGQKTW